MSKPFFDALYTRRSIYSLAGTSSISDEKIEEIIQQTLLRVPSAFNSQSTRCVLLLREEHEKFWEMVRTVLCGNMESRGESARAERTRASLNRRGAAFGTVLFYESTAAWKPFAERTPDYADLFPGWADHTSGMHQLVIWTALETEGLGGNLQHYHYESQVQDRARDMYDVPLDWEMKAQLVFGGWDGVRPPDRKQPDEKLKEPSSEKMKVFGKRG